MIQTPKINLIHGDCMELMRETPDGFYDLAIVDTPYGIKMGGGHKGSEKRGDKNKYKQFAGNDSEIPDKHYFDELFRVSKNQIIWGGNYMIDFLYPSPCFIIWDKVQPAEFSMAMCEMAWASFDSPAKIFKMRVVGASDFRHHPTQKPTLLYKWLLTNYAKPGDRIFDSHGGSMSIAIAAYDLGFDLDLTELDKDYYDAGVARFERHRAQGQLFHTPAIQLPEQQKMF